MWAFFLQLTAIFVALQVGLSLSLRPLESEAVAQSGSDDSLRPLESEDVAQSGSDDNVIKLAQAYNVFGLKVYHHLKQRHDNVVFSPYVAATVASMLLARMRFDPIRGAQEQLIFPEVDMSDEEYRRAYQKMSSSLSYQVYRSFAAIGTNVPYHAFDSYRDELRRTYSTEIETLHFDKTNDSREQIVQRVTVPWILKTKLMNMLRDPLLNNQTSLVLGSELSRHHYWHDSIDFDAGRTKEEEFHNYNGTRVKVPFMYTFNHRLNYTYNEELGIQIVEIPLKSEGPEVSLYIILPNEGGLDDLEDKLTVASIDKALDEMTENTIEVRLPRIPLKIVTDRDLKNRTRTRPSRSLQEVASSEQEIKGHGDLAVSGEGFVAAFGMDENSGMDLFGFSVLTVETIAEIAGITGQNVKQVFCNRPYLFLVRDKRFGLILQMASIRNL